MIPPTTAVTITEILTLIGIIFAVVVPLYVYHFNKLNKRFDKMDNKFDKMDNKLEGMSKEITNMRIQINRIEHKVGLPYSNSINSNGTIFNNIEEEFSAH